MLSAVLAITIVIQDLDDPRLGVETWSAGLSRPVAFAFVGPGEMLVMQNLDGQVLRIVDGVVQNVALDLTVSQQGGLGIEVGPTFDQDGFVYLYYGEPNGGVDGGDWNGSHLVRAVFDGTHLGAPSTPLFTSPFDAAFTNANDHNSGVIRFGSDDMLYLQVGDKHRADAGAALVEQNTGALISSGAGGIARLNPDGSIPLDNPFAALADPALHPWFVYGFRNSFGMDFDPQSGDLWFGDNGSTAYDEINHATPGMNGGWTRIMGPDARDAVYAENGNQAFDEADLVMLPGSEYRDPEISWVAPIGVTFTTFLDSECFPVDLRTDLVVGDFNAGQLYRFDLDANREHIDLPPGLADGVADNNAERDLVRFGTGFGAATDARIGPDGFLYLTDYFGGRIRRVLPLADCDDNGIPDECEELADCNGNAVPDLCDIAAGSSSDGDGNGVPDECECLVTPYCSTAPNSVGPGATISISGTTGVAANDFVLEVSSVIPGGFGLFYYGSSQQQTPFGDGFRCIAGAVLRLGPPMASDMNGLLSRAVDLTAPPQPSGQIEAGTVWNFQYWYRDTTGPGASGFNLSDALEVQFCL